MSLCVSLHMKDKQVLIVGGGKVAYRKAILFLEESAKLSVISPSFLKEFSNLDVNMQKRNFQPEDCEGKFFVYAATNDIQLNHQIIEHANQKNILCGSATQDTTANSTSMSTIEEQGILCAFATRGAFPAWHQQIKRDVQQFLKQTYEGKAIYLKQLREYILQEKLPFTMWEELPRLSLEELTFLVDAITTKKCILYAFHGVANQPTLHQLYETMQTFKKHHTQYAHGVVFLSEKVCGKLQYQVSIIYHMIKLIKGLGVFHIHVFPMLMSEGKYEQALQTFTQEENITYDSILCHNQEQADKIMDEYMNLYHAKKILFVIHDVCSFKTLTYFKNSVARYIHADIISYKEPVALDTTEDVMVIPLVMLLGHHAKKDILYGSESICEKMIQSGIRVRKVERAVFDHEFIKDIYIQSISTIEV